MRNLEQIHRDRKWKRGGQGLAGRRERELVFKGEESPVLQEDEFRRWTAVTVTQQRECSDCRGTEYLNMAKRINIYVMYIYHNFFFFKEVWLSEC